MHVGENEYLPKLPKAYDIGTPVITAEEGTAPDGTPQVTLSTVRPALWVTGIWAAIRYGPTIASPCFRNGQG